MMHCPQFSGTKSLLFFEHNHPNFDTLKLRWSLPFNVSAITQITSETGMNMVHTIVSPRYTDPKRRSINRLTYLRSSLVSLALIHPCLLRYFSLTNFPGDLLVAVSSSFFQHFFSDESDDFCWLFSSASSAYCFWKFLRISKHAYYKYDFCFFHCVCF